MTTTTIFSLYTAIFLLISLHIQAQTPTAPSPKPSGPVNVTGILDKNGQFTTFIRLLNSTQVANQLENQLNSTTEGFTIFAPTDNAFNTLKAGTINDLSTQQQVQLVLGHIIPKYYTLNNLLLVSNPVRTQATGQDGGFFGLNFTGQGNQVNVSTGIVDTQINNVLRQEFPLALYQVEKVLLPEELFGVKAPKAAPAPQAKASSGDSKKNSTLVASEPAPIKGSSSVVKTNLALGFVLAIGLACMGVLS